MGSYVANTPPRTSWVCPDPYVFRRSLKIAWVWSHPRRRACEKTRMPLKKVWLTHGHDRRTSRKISSLTVWVCSHPQRTAFELSSLTWGAADAEIKVSHLMRTQSLKVLPLKPGVGQCIAKHATLTATDFFLGNFYPSGPFICIFSKTSPKFFLC